jgi:hypothetical protein
MIILRTILPYTNSEVVMLNVNQNSHCMHGHCNQNSNKKSYAQIVFSPFDKRHSFTLRSIVHGEVSTDPKEQIGVHPELHSRTSPSRTNQQQGKEFFSLL